MKEPTSTRYFISRSFRSNWRNYIWQSLIAGLVAFVSIYVLAELIGLLILAGIGSTFFTVFALPGNRTAQPRNVIGGYLLCIAVGLLASLIPSPCVSGGVAVGAAAFLMVMTDTEHPPAAGVALGLALTTSPGAAVPGALCALAAAVVASLLKRLLSRWLVDLV